MARTTKLRWGRGKRAQQLTRLLLGSWVAVVARLRTCGWWQLDFAVGGVNGLHAQQLPLLRTGHPRRTRMRKADGRRTRATVGEQEERKERRRSSERISRFVSPWLRGSTPSYLWVVLLFVFVAVCGQYVVAARDFAVSLVRCSWRDGGARESCGDAQARTVGQCVSPRALGMWHVELGVLSLLCACCVLWHADQRWNLHGYASDPSKIRENLAAPASVCPSFASTFSRYDLSPLPPLSPCLLCAVNALEPIAAARSQYPWKHCERHRQVDFP